MVIKMTDTAKKDEKIIDGKAIAAQCRAEIAQEVAAMTRKPSLAVIIVGENPASQVYVRNKEKACIEAGIRSSVYRLPKETSQSELMNLIDRLNADDETDGILVQLPLPKKSEGGSGIDESAVLAAISGEKDVDAFGAENVGHIMMGDFHMLPCTPAGVMTLLEKSGVDPAGKECVIVGRSNIVGKPMALLLLHKNATVTIAHSKTRELSEVCRRADILVVAVGRAGLITGDMIKDGAVVIDVGMNRDEQGKLCGDVDFESVYPRAAKITPVPGGVGPMTITTLLRNTVTAAKFRHPEIYGKQ